MAMTYTVHVLNDMYILCDSIVVRAYCLKSWIEVDCSYYGDGWKHHSLTRVVVLQLSSTLVVLSIPYLLLRYYSKYKVSTIVVVVQYVRTFVPREYFQLMSRV